jgi:hypothetical protein
MQRIFNQARCERGVFAEGKPLSDALAVNGRTSHKYVTRVTADCARSN